MVRAMTDLSVYLIDRDAARRDAAALMFGREGIRFQLFADTDDFLARTQPESSGCVLVEWTATPGEHLPAIEFARRAALRSYAMPIVFFGSPGDPIVVRDAFRAGAADFLIAPYRDEDMLAAVRSAFADEKKRALARRRARQRDNVLAALTAREREVASLAAQGHDNQLIGKRLGISHRTVEVHKSRLMRKIGARSLADLIRLGPTLGR